MQRTPPQASNANKIICPGCRQTITDFFSAGCIVCKHQYHISCVELTAEEQKSLQFTCKRCIGKLQDAGRSVATRLFSEKISSEALTPNKTITISSPNKIVKENKLPADLKDKTTNIVVSNATKKVAKSTKSVKSTKSHQSAAKMKILEERLSILKEKEAVLKQMEALSENLDNSDNISSISDQHQDDEQPQTSRQPNQQSTPVNTGAQPNSQSTPVVTPQEDLSDEAVARRFMSRMSISKDLPVFSGHPEEWPLFISTFNRTTEICGYSNDENLIRLCKALQGDAKRKVANQLILPSCVPNIIKTLEKIYGRPETILKNQILSIRKIPEIRMENLHTITELSLAVDNLCASLQASQMHKYFDNPTLLDELIAKLPNTMKLEWRQFSKKYPTINLITFQEWLAEKSDDAILFIPPESKKSEVRYKNTKDRINTHVEASSSSNVCIVCQGDCEKVVKCDKFKNMSLADKWNVVKDKKLCRCCLKRHSLKSGKCYSAKRCGIDECTAFHNQLLHNNKKPAANEPKQEFCGNHTSNVKNCQFRYMPVLLSNSEMKISIKVLAFMDEGSSGTYMDQALADKLKLKGKKSPLYLKWTDGYTRLEQNSITVSCEVSNTHNSIKYELNNVRTVENLNLPLQTLDYDSLCLKYPHIRELPVESYVNIRPQILIGLNNWRYAIPLNIKEGTVEEPVAIKCRLGWTIIHTQKNPDISNYAFFHEQTEKNDDDKNLQEMLNKFFSIEMMGVKTPKYDEASLENQHAIDLMNSTTKRIGNRFETGLLWKNSQIVLPDSKPMALQRLMSLERRLKNDQKLFNNVKKQFGEYEAKGYIRKLTSEELQQNHTKVWYLPVFPTSNPNKPEKIRLVWDAKAKVDGMSLNDALLKGPDQLSSLFGILHRFREKPVAIVGDIAEMFHQVKIIPEDQHAQRFLWRDCDQNQDPAEYVMNVMTFGAKCSPASAQFVKNLNAKEFESTHPRAYESIVKNHYVDDMLDCCYDDEECITLIKQVTEVHQKGGFVIRNFKSNSQVVMNFINKNNNNQITSVNMDSEKCYEKVLGMWWDTKNDSFTFLLKFNKGNIDVLKNQKRPTKREVLRILMSVYDPLGLINHYLSYLKVLMQEIWISKINWDEFITDKQFKKWLKWIGELPKIEELSIARSLLATDSVVKYENINKQIHIFVDASKNNCIAVAYLRLNYNEKVEIKLIGSKSKVAPIKILSIPRLELIAALIGSRIGNSISSSFSFDDCEIYYWTDSKTVLNWLNIDAKSISGQFVAFRVAEIQSSTNINSWRYVPSGMNVADDGTKWDVAPQVNINQRWFQGPEFLTKSEEFWPKNIVPQREIQMDLVSYHDVSEPVIEFHNFSKYHKLLRTVVIVQRFIQKICRNDVSFAKIMTCDELKCAEVAVIKMVQAESFQDEIKCLLNNQPIKSNSVLRQLNPYLDEENIVRSKGRCAKSEHMKFDAKNLIVLPRKHQVTDLIIKMYHEKYLHQNNETVVNQIRQKFHIPKLRQAIKGVVYKCQHCKNNRAKPKCPKMADLPKCRLAAFEPVFSHCGVDYFGPLNVKIGRCQVKRWGCLFTCLSTRAIHIEVAHKLDTDHFILCYRNFINRRGPISHMYSDNGTNFVGAEKILKESIKNIDKERLAATFVNPELNWHFNPPTSPHMGGSWERMVKSVKNSLYAIKPFHTMTDALLNSYLIEIEDIINSRPLTYLPLDSEESEAITPNHFLKGSGATSTNLNIRDDAKFLKSNWQNAQLLKQQFWKRWVSEYLPTLNRRGKWFNNVEPLKVDDIVIICDPNSVRGSWPKGRIISVNVGGDGQVRSAKVKTSIGCFTRPVVHLAKLDVIPPQEESVKNNI